VLSDAGRLADAAGAIRARQRHEVRVALYGVALAELTHPVIEAFCQRYPNVSIRVYDADFHRGLDPVLAGEYDAALARLNTDVPACRPGLRRGRAPDGPARDRCPACRARQVTTEPPSLGGRVSRPRRDALLSPSGRNELRIDSSCSAARSSKRASGSSRSRSRFSLIWSSR